MSYKKPSAEIMKTRLFPITLLVLGLALAIFLSAERVQAALGESVDSVASDQKAISAVRRAMKTSTGYTVHEIRSETITVREYVSPSGVVFGIAWNGLTHPDLTPLLGAYTDEYQKAMRKAKRQPGRRHVQVKTDGVVVEKWGHMRKLQGRAYAPALIPQGVSVDEIK
jgi:hypothetical protein